MFVNEKNLVGMLALFMFDMKIKIRKVYCNNVQIYKNIQNQKSESTKRLI